MTQFGDMRAGDRPVLHTHVQAPVMPAPNGGAWGYPLSKLTQDDKFFLYKMDYWYRIAIGSLSGPGPHGSSQLYFDMLTDANGQTYWHTEDEGFKAQVNGVINDNDAVNPTAQRFDVDAYTGPLKQCYANLLSGRQNGTIGMLPGK